MDKGLKKGISIVFLANILNLVFSLLRNFLLPKYLPVDTYADIKTYQLFISYSGLFALGYVDGMYLKYGGKNISEIDIPSFSKNLSTFRIFQTALSIVCIIIALLLHDEILCFVAITIPFLTIVDYYKCFFQAVGEFSVYSKILNASSSLMFIVSMILLFIGKRRDSFSFILAFTVIYGVVLVIVELYFRVIKQYKFSYFCFSLREIKESIFSGFALMVSLLITNFMTGLDRWFVKFTLSTLAFAQYSFAASVLGFLSYAVSPISITMYNYFCKQKQHDIFANAKQGIILFASTMILCAFPIKFILEMFLNEYIGALMVIIILFAEQVPNAIIRCFYVNLYKSSKRQSDFLKKVVYVVIIGVVLNAFAYIVTKRMEGYAIATAISSIIWLLFSMKDFAEYRLTVKEMLFSSTTICVFIVCGIALPSYIGVVIYAIYLLLAMRLLIPHSYKLLRSFLPGFLKRKTRRNEIDGE